MTASEMIATFWDNSAKRRISPLIHHQMLKDTIAEVEFAIKRPSYDAAAARWYKEHPDATRSDF